MASSPLLRLSKLYPGNNQDLSSPGGCEQPLALMSISSSSVPSQNIFLGSSSPQQYTARKHSASVWSLASRWRYVCFPADKQLCWGGSRKHINPPKVSCNLRSLYKFKFNKLHVESWCRGFLRTVTSISTSVHQAASQHSSSLSQDLEKGTVELQSQSPEEVMWRALSLCALSPSSLPSHTPPFVDQVVGYPSSRTLWHWFLTLQQSICLWIPGNESNGNLQVQRWKLTLCHDKGQTKQRRPLFSFNTGRSRIRLKLLLGSRWLGRWVPQQRRGDPLPWFRWVGDGSRPKSSKGNSTEHTTSSTMAARKQETAQYQGPNPVFYRNVTQPKNLDAFSSLCKAAPRPATCVRNRPMFMPVPVTACPPMPIL